MISYVGARADFQNERRVYGGLARVDSIDGKSRMQCDETERGIANELVEAGVPRDRIVLGFRSPAVRKHTEFAVA